MSNKVKDMFVVILVAAFFLIFSLWAMIKPAGEMSESERRKLTQKPELTIDSLLSGKYMTSFEGYTTDQFPLREAFRSAKAIANYYGFLKKDMNDIYISQGYESKLEYKLDYSSLDKAAEKFEVLFQNYFRGEDVKAYFSIIPDKNYFLAKRNGYPSLDYEALRAYLREKTPSFSYIDIFDYLDIEDYYKTDTHWRQEKIQDVAITIGKAMGRDVSAEYEMKKLEKEFHGVYYGQAALPVAGEDLYYLTNSILDSCEVFDYETGKAISVYDMERGMGKDPYEIFLSGPKSLISVKNPNATSDRRLIIFRDSFGSSIAPLLVPGYAEVVLVDIRYLASANVGKFVSFENSDVLVLYSTMVLNNSVTLK